MLVFHNDELVPKRYTNLDFQSNKDSCWPTSNLVFTFGDVAIIFKSMKQSCIIDSTMKLSML